jgi:hypothetical protein
MTEFGKRIAAALDAAGSYFDRCLAQRNPGPAALGSVFEQTQTRESLLSAAWEPYSHPDVAAPAVAFRAPIAGTVGVVLLAELPGNTPVKLADPKGTGFVEATAQLEDGPRSEWTTLLLGPGKDGQETLYTFFPGAPVKPSTLAADHWNGFTVKASEAIRLGLTVAKAEWQSERKPA